MTQAVSPNWSEITQLELDKRGAGRLRKRRFQPGAQRASIRKETKAIGRELCVVPLDIFLWACWVKGKAIPARIGSARGAKWVLASAQPFAQRRVNATQSSIFIYPLRAAARALSSPYKMLATLSAGQTLCAITITSKQFHSWALRYGAHYKRTMAMVWKLFLRSSTWPIEHGWILWIQLWRHEDHFF